MKMIAIVAAAALLGGTTFSQLDIPDGGTYTDGFGNTATVDVVDNPEPGVIVQITTDDGFTPATDGTAGASSTADAPTCSSAPAATTSGGNDQVRIKKINGKSRVQIKKNGRWRTMRLTKPKPPKRQIQRLTPSPGEEGTSLPDPYAPQAV